MIKSKVRFLSLPVLWWYQDFQNLLPNHNAEMTDVQYLKPQLSLKDHDSDRRMKEGKNLKSNGEYVR